MPENENKDRKRRLKAFGLFVIVCALIAVAVFAVVQMCGGNEMLATAYYSGNPDINAGVAVLFRKEVVGTVDSIHAGLRCVHVEVRRFGEEDFVESATILLDSARTVGDSATGQYRIAYATDRVTIAPVGHSGTPATSAIEITRDPATALWTMRIDAAWSGGPAGRGGAILLDETPVGSALMVLNEANEIGLPGGLRIRWSEPEVHACAYMRLDTARIRELANLGTQDRLPISATVATLSTGFALARPGVRLILPPDVRGSLVASNAMELMPAQDFDLYAVLNEVGGYLTDRRSIVAPPRNRIERAVNNVNGGLTRLDSVTGQIERITSDASRYLSSPAALRERPRTRLDSLVADLNSLKGIVADVRNDFSTLSGKAGRAVDNIDRTTVPRLNTALDDLGGTLTAIDTLVRNVDRLALTLKDTTFLRAEGSMKSVADDITAMREDVRRLVHSLNMFLINLR